MAFTVTEFRDLVALLVEHPEWRAELRPLILGDEILRIPAAIAAIDEHLATMAQRLDVTGERLDALTAHYAGMSSRVDARFDSVDERLTGMDGRFDTVDTRFDAADTRFDTMDTRFDAVDTRFDAMDARFDAVDTRFDAMDARFDAVDTRFEAADTRFDTMDTRFDTMDVSFGELKAGFGDLGSRFNRLEGRFSNIEGSDLERRYRERLQPYFGTYVKNPRAVQVSDLQGVREAVDAGVITPDQVSRLADLDLIVVGREGLNGASREIVIAAEISHTINREDVERAARGAAILRLAGYEAVSLVGGYELSRTVALAAGKAGVIVDQRRKT